MKIIRKGPICVYSSIAEGVKAPPAVSNWSELGPSFTPGKDEYLLVFRIKNLSRTYIILSHSIALAALENDYAKKSLKSIGVLLLL